MQQRRAQLGWRTLLVLVSMHLERGSGVEGVRVL